MISVNNPLAENVKLADGAVFHLESDKITVTDGAEKHDVGKTIVYVAVVPEN